MEVRVSLRLYNQPLNILSHYIVTQINRVANVTVTLGSRYCATRDVASSSSSCSLVHHKGFNQNPIHLRFFLSSLACNSHHILITFGFWKNVFCLQWGSAHNRYLYNIIQICISSLWLTSWDYSGHLWPWGHPEYTYLCSNDFLAMDLHRRGRGLSIMTI